METPESPKPPEKSTSDLLAQVVVANFAALLVLGGLGGFIGMLALPVLNLVIGVALLFTAHRKLGKVILLSGLVVGLLGLGTCALILSNLRVNH
ncbi:hypothetical protein K3G63_02080 [Hymenobacter sp. HSC-4F20]|uniref:hypothetical protein n=1 Tax=Hymenobacter sp. HSC-4F20 TaxID=2864135 RepID=UPI001C729DB5|nr:hypothetical protein [Hymenobacter sp. HSC-4F20]MBX0289206.1 hypothetical protein [Hymenobacter sp. HSC-4F20]